MNTLSKGFICHLLLLELIQEVASNKKYHQINVSGPSCGNSPLSMRLPYGVYIPADLKMAACDCQTGSDVCGREAAVGRPGGHAGGSPDSGVSVAPETGLSHPILSIPPRNT